MNDDSRPQRHLPHGQMSFEWCDALAKAGRKSFPSASVTNEASGPAGNLAAFDGGYGPGHPWHYLPQGDNATPVPFEAIPCSEIPGHLLVGSLPKSAAKRIVKLCEMLESDRRELEEARRRYENVITRGADALSRYDREIAYGGDDQLARAGTLALLFNQISYRLGRIAWLERQQASVLFR